MRLRLGTAAAGSRDAWIGLALATMVLAFVLVAGVQMSASAGGEQTAPAPTQPAAPAPPARVFNLGAAMILNNVKPDKTADFEMVMGKVKEALQKSEDPIRKQQLASWKVYKAAEPGPNGSVLYVFVMDPAVKDSDYTIGKILSEGFPTDVQTLYKTFSESYAGGQTPINLGPVLDMSK
jgi:hypothetical protein